MGKHCMIIFKQILQLYSHITQSSEGNIKQVRKNDSVTHLKFNENKKQDLRLIPSTGFHLIRLIEKKNVLPASNQV